ncbi:hypothetical protein [Chryseobacterium geocarposphaerae]|uniref:Lipoprotein n=1 Tax=Chryseobacterium geocarposphaerae TaxID=1416776 RepID=A0A2M9CAD7_9FLAO|nr:hypothetical protein [Chryseobacterium geocarposphaerae]PJJ67732.1 hypothetical protein CLV73_1751 [Chryseobacterium geocarposphaerae]
MKKFISWVSTIVVFITVVSCREAEELTTTADEMQNQSIATKIKKDSVGIKSVTLPPNEATLSDGPEGDPPPKKDEIKW